MNPVPTFFGPYFLKDIYRRIIFLIGFTKINHHLVQLFTGFCQHNIHIIRNLGSKAYFLGFITNKGYQ